MSDIDDTRIKVLRSSDRYAPVDGSPGNWIDTRTGIRFHYTAFVVMPEWCEFPCPDRFGPVKIPPSHPPLGEGQTAASGLGRGRP